MNRSGSVANPSRSTAAFRVPFSGTLFVVLCIAMLAVFAVFGAAQANAAFTISDWALTPSTTQAGGHPNVNFHLDPDGAAGDKNGDDLKKVVVDFSAGMLGNPEAVSSANTCTTSKFNQDKCPSGGQIGTATVQYRKSGQYFSMSGSVYKLTPDPDSAMTFGFIMRPSGFQKIFLKSSKVGGVATVRTGLDADYGLTATIDSIPRTLTTTWGSVTNVTISNITVNIRARSGSSANGPYFTFNPTRCTAASTRATMTSYLGVVISRTSSYTPTNCGAVPFAPTFTAAPTSTVANATTGISATIGIPTADATIQQSHIKNITTTLPEGTGLNFPAIGAIAALCSDAQLNADTCPAGSKIGTASAVVPFLPPTMTGDIYLTARNTQIQFGYILRGARGIKAVLKGSAMGEDPDGNGIGAVVARVINLPQAPYSSATLNFTAQLLQNASGPCTPNGQTITAAFTGYSGATATRISSHTLTSGCSTEPETNLTSGPASPTNDNTPTFVFSSPSAGVTGFECQIDASAYSTCASPYTTSALSDTTHTFSVRAVNATTSDSTPASQTFIVDTTPPGPPNVISPTEGALVLTSSVSIAFTAEPGTITTCALDGGAASACSSGKTYSGLVDGPHSVVVTATDAAGNPSSTTRNFTVDTQPPVVTITSPVPGSVSSSSSVSIGFSVTGAVGPTTCRIDSGPASACTSPFLPTLPDGSHTITICATDAAGNTTCSSITFTVDTTGPVVNISSPTEGATVATAITSVVFTATDLTTSVASRTCRTDAGAAAACTSPYTTPALGNGPHSVTIVATDVAGNSTTAVRNFNVSIPVTPPPNTTLNTGAITPSNDNTPTFTFSADQVATFECSVDSSSFAACVSPFTTSSLADGPHTFQVRATNANGTDATPAGQTFVIDTVGPNLVISTPSEGATLPPGAVAVTFSATDVTTSVTGSTCRTDAGAAAACSSPYTTPVLAAGPHSVTIVSSDAAGNTTTGVRNFVIGSAPNTTLVAGPTSPTNDNTPTFTFSSDQVATFECRVDAAAFAVCASPFTTAVLAEGSRTFQVRATNANGTDASPATSTFVVDTVGPVVNISSPTEGQVVSSAVTSVVFTATDVTTSVTGTTCRTDAGAATACSSPYSTPSLLAGPHSVTIIGTDAAGNTTTAVRNFTYTPTPAPDTTIVSGPSNPTNDNTPTFTFSSNQVATFECRVDAASFAACTTPHTTATLADGLRTFQVRATNANGTDASPATSTFVVDTVGPVVNITSPAEGAALPPGTVSVVFTTTDVMTSVASTTCRTDAGAAAACTSPYTTPVLAAGPHSVTILSTDAAGNPTTAVRNFTISPAPNTTIVTGPTSPTGDNTPTFSFTSDQTATFECRVDAAVFAACTSPFTTATLADGSRTFQVRAVNANGTDATPASSTFVVDTIGPVVNISSPTENQVVSSAATPVTFTATDATTSVTGTTCRTDAGAAAACTSPYTTPALLSGPHSVTIVATDAAGNTTTAVRNFTYTPTPAPDTTILTGPTNPTTDNTPTFTFSSNQTATFQCSVDGSAFAACTTPFTTGTLTDGSHNFQVRATNANGTDASPASLTFTVDISPPIVTITSPLEGASLAPGAISVSFTATDPHTPPVTTTCRTDAAAAAACTSPYTTPVLAAGPHSVTIVATNQAGLTTTVVRSFTILSPPNTTIVTGPTSPTNDNTPTFTFSSDQTATFECRVDAAAFAACTTPHTTATLADGSRTFQVRATNANGTDATPASQTFVVDTIGPVVNITAPTEGQALAPGTVSVTFTATDATTSVAGTTCRTDAGTAAACTSPYTTPALTAGPHSVTLVSTDAAGNQTTAVRNFTISPAPNTTLLTGPTSPTTDNTPTFTFSSDQAATFQCRVDAAVFAACTTPHTTAALTDGSHTFEVRATNANGTDATPAAQTFVVDVSPPVLTITSPTEGASLPPGTVSVNFTATDPHTPPVTTTCRTDAAAAASCTSPYTTPALTAGPHSVTIVATNQAGLTTTVVRSFTIASPPNTTILTGPTSPTTDNTPTFTFSSDQTATFECRVDAAAFAACTTPHTTATLADGSRTFQVRAVNANGTDATPASSTFVVDVSPPVLTITSPTEGASLPPGTVSVNFTATDAHTPPVTTTCRTDAAAAASCTSPYTTPALAAGPHSVTIVATNQAGLTTTVVRSFTIASPPNTSFTGVPNNPTTDNTPTFSFSSDQTATFECRVDAAAFAACTTPHTTATLADGSRTFQVRATNANGTDATPASQTFVVDTVGPVVNITAPTEGQALPPGTVSVTFTATDVTTSVAGTTCRTDAGAAAACTSPYTTPALTTGPHSVTLVSTDAAGNQTTAVRNFSIAGTPPDTTITSGPPPATADTTPDFAFAATPPAGATFECSVDGGSYSACPTPFTLPAQGDIAVHRLQVRAVNGSGSDPTPASQYFLVDTRPFATTATVTPTTTAAGAHPDVTATATIQGAADVKSADIVLAHGLMGSLASVSPRCTPAQATAGTCPAASKIGSGSGTGVSPRDGLVTTTSADIFLVDPSPGTPGEAAEIAVKAIAPNGLGTIIATGSIVLRNNGTNIAGTIDNIPTTTDLGNSFHITSVQGTLLGNTGGPAHPLITNPSACVTPANPVSPNPAHIGPFFNIIGNATAYGGAIAPTLTIPYPTTNCTVAELPYTPTFTQVFTNPTAGATTGIVATLNVPLNHSTTFRARVVEPAKVGVNFPAFGSSGDQCAGGSAPNGIPGVGNVPFNPTVTDSNHPGGCLASSKVGTIVVTTPALSADVTGDIYLIYKGTLPWLGIDIKPQAAYPNNPQGVNLRLILTTSLPQVDPLCDPAEGPCQTQLAVDTRYLPDIPLTKAVINLNGGSRVGSESGQTLSGDFMQFLTTGDPTCDPGSFSQNAIGSFYPWARQTTPVVINSPVAATGC